MLSNQSTPEQPFGIELAVRGAENTPPPTPAEPEQKPTKVAFDDAQKARVNEIVREASARAGAEARAEAARLKTELETARRTQTPNPPGEDTTLALATARAEVASLRSAQEEGTLKNALLAAVSGESFYDVGLAADLLRQGAKIVGGKVVFLDAEGNQRLNASFEPITPAEAARALAQEKAFLVRSQSRGGVGSTPSQGVPTTGPRLEELFGKNSNGGAANRLALHDPQRYKELRRVAVSRGLLPR